MTASARVGETVTVVEETHDELSSSDDCHRWCSAAF
jgi:hypothetical protein